MVGPSAEHVLVLSMAEASLGHSQASGGPAMLTRWAVSK